MKDTDTSKSPVISKYNIICTDETIIRPCIFTPIEIPKLKFQFQPISTVQEMEKNDTIDVLGIIEKFDDVQHKRLSSGVNGRSRAIWIVDQSKSKVITPKLLHFTKRFGVKITQKIKQIELAEINDYQYTYQFRLLLLQILLYIWGTNADNFGTNRPGDVIAVKRAKVKTYAKLNLDSSCLSSSTFEVKKG